MIGWRISDGSTNLDLSDLTNGLMDGVVNGNAPTHEETTTDQYHFELRGVRATVESLLSQLQVYLERAKARQEKPFLTAIYVERNLGDGVWWRSEVVDGDVWLDDDSLDKLGRGGTPVTVVITRKNWWEGAEAAVPLSNPHETDNTTGLMVHNPDLRYAAATISFDTATREIRDSANGLAVFAAGTVIWLDGSTSNDGYYTVDTSSAGALTVTEALIADEAAGATVTILGEPCNYITIDGADISGNLPAPVRFELTNAYDHTNRLGKVWMGQNVEADPVNFEHILQGEDASYGGTLSDGMYSHGRAMGFTWTGDTAAMIGRWTLDSTFLNRAGGRWFKLLAVFSAQPISGTWLQCKVTFPAGTPLTVVGSSQEVQLSTLRIQDVGTLQLPPWLVGAGDLAPIDLTLYARKTGGGSLGIDYIQLTPIDGYRILTPKGYSAAYGVRIVDDGINNLLWTDGWDPAGKTGHYVGVGERIQLQPNRTQRICFLQFGDTGDVSLSRLLTVKAFYRPRRATI